MKLKRPYSPSSLDVANCGYRYFRTYLDPDRPKQKVESVPQARGSAVHEVLGRITEELVKGRKTFTDDTIREWVAASVVMHPAAAEETKDILKMARDYLLNPPDPLHADAIVEQALAVKLENGEFVKCEYGDPLAYARGRIDIMMTADGDPTKAIIYDHKTQPNMEDADTFQLGFYAWLVFKTDMFVDEVQTILHFARYGKYSQPYVWKREELNDIEDEIITRVQINESRTDWSATPNKHCQYCPFISECPAMEQYLERDSEGRLRPKKTSLKILGDTNKAVEIAGALTVLENLTNEMKKELRAHVDVSNSPVAVPGVRWGYVVKENVIDWDYANKHQRQELYQIFEKHKVDPRHFMGFSQTFSSKIWQAEKPRLAEELNAILRREHKSEFRARKV